MPIYRVFAKLGTIVAVQPQGTRRVPSVLAITGLLLALPWAFFTMLEVDQGWEDAIWRYDPWRRDVIVVTWIGVLAGVAAAMLALGRSRRLAWAALAIEAAAAVTWTVLMFVTPS